MKKSIPLFLFLSLVIIFFRSVFLHGLLPIPSDDLIGLYNPFRDVFSQQFPRGVPFKNFLITDPIRQQYPWRELAITMEKHLQIPLWNPYSFSGYPLLANFQSGAFYPLNIVFFFMPFSSAWTVLIFLQPFFAGIFLYWYLRNLKLHPIASFLGGVAFAFSGFSVAWMEWGIILQTFMWVPLILLAKDKLNVKWSKKWMLVFLFAEIASFLAGHLQIWFYALCVTNAYLFLRIFQKTKYQQAKNFFMQYSRNYFPFFLVGLGFFAITAIQWLPTAQFILLSGRGADQTYLQPGWFIPYQHLIQFIVPDFFGNPTTLNYWGVWNYGELVGYIGIIPLFFAFFAVVARHDKKTYFFGSIALLALLFALPTPIGLLPFKLHIPFLSTSQPTRLLSVVDFALAVLGAVGLDYFMKTKSKILLGILGTFIIFFGLLWATAQKMYSVFGISLTNAHIARQNMVFPSVVFLFFIIIIFLWHFFLKRKNVVVVLSICLIVVTCFDLLRFSEKFNPFTPQSYLYPQSSTLTFLQKNIGNYRFMTTDSQILPPNVSDIYRLQSVDGYDPLYINAYGAFIAALQRNKPDITTPYGFNRIITPHNYMSPLINILGVKYVMTLSNINDKGFQEVFKEGQTKVYENTRVLPRTFFVDKIIATKDDKQSIESLFVYKDSLRSVAIVSNVARDMVMVGLGDAFITGYTPNRITIITKNSNPGFLVLTDVYYPTWHAAVDGVGTKIYQTDFAFRGVFIPSGNHTVVFQDSLF